jgi:hypothetical protein
MYRHGSQRLAPYSARINSTQSTDATCRIYRLDAGQFLLRGSDAIQV